MTKTRLQSFTMWITGVISRWKSLHRRRPAEVITPTELQADWRREEVYPCRRLPNVREFKVEVLSDWNPILKKSKLRLKKRMFNPLITSIPHSNKSINRYIEHQFKRLNKHRKNPAAFWRIGKQLMKSPSYHVNCLQNVLPTWHRTESYRSIWKVMTELTTLSRTWSSDLEYKRVWIPKGNGGTRPLGVPSLKWRIWLHGLQNILVVWLSVYQPPNQHGFLPGRGTKTAWSAILETGLDKQNIYEFDLRSFFSSINKEYLRQTLIETKMEGWMINWLTKLNESLPSNGEYLTDTWPDRHSHLTDYKEKVTGSRVWHGLSWEESYWEWRLTSSEKLDPKWGIYEWYRGLPQGSPLSPILSCLCLVKWLNSHREVIQYADDGIISTDAALDPTKYLSYPEGSGITVNWSKSRWLRKEGIWLLPLKFLGLEYEHTPNAKSEEGVKEGTLRNKTRIPKPFVLQHLSLFEKAEQYEKDLKSGVNKVSPERGLYGPNFEWWFKRKYSGYLLSRLYNGSYTQEDLIQDFSYKFRTWSWSHIQDTRWTQRNGEKPPNLNIFNSSSFAAKSLSNRLKHYVRTNSAQLSRLE